MLLEMVFFPNGQVAAHGQAGDTQRNQNTKDSVLVFIGFTPSYQKRRFRFNYPNG